MVSLAIPICFVITLGCLQMFGMTLNILSMMGLLLAVGMLVDNAVVVVESIYHYRERFPDKPWYCAVQGTQVVGIAIAAGTMSSIIVFLPLVFGEKANISIFLTQVAITMAIAHLSSWLVAVSRADAVGTPAAAEVHRPQEHHHAVGAYGRFIAATLSHRRWTMVAHRAARHQHRAAGRAHQDGHVPGGRKRSHVHRLPLNALYPLADLRHRSTRSKRISTRTAWSSTSRISTAATPRTRPTRSRRSCSTRTTRPGRARKSGKTAQGIAQGSDRRGRIRLQRQRFRLRQDNQPEPRR
jgi:HAE1 family hydrophobic/amphiphilic exporter-1